MNRIQLIVIVGFALAFAAGGSVGILAGPEVQDVPRRKPGFPLERELALTPEQRERMRRIWSEVMDGGEAQRWQRRDELWQRRNEAIDALLTEEQKARYDQILAEHARALEEIEQERHRLVEQAVQRTREVLTPEQARKYDEIRQKKFPGKRRGGRPPHGRPPHGWKGGPSTRGSPFGPGPEGRGFFPGPRRRPPGPPARGSRQSATNPAQP